MKKSFVTIILLVAAIFTFGQNNTVKRKVLVKPFSAIKVSGASDVTLIKGDDYIVVVKAPERIQDAIHVNVKGETLTITYSNIKLKNHENLKFYVTTPVLKKLHVSGAADVTTEGATFKGENLKIIASGAADVELTLDYKTIDADVSGASSVELAGKAGVQRINASGAADYTAKELAADTVAIVASGASSVYVNVIHKIDYRTTGAADVKFKGDPEEWNLDSVENGTHMVISSPSTGVVVNGNDYNDTTKVKVGSIDVEVVDGDTVTVRIGGHQLKVNDDGNVQWERVDEPRFNGHWGGVELGINGYVTPDFNTGWGKENDYLNLIYEKSIAVNLNLWEQNIPFNKQRTVGMLTGLGMSWNNYFFSNKTKLVNGTSGIEGYYIEGVSVRKTKLTNMYITVPVLFEFQTGIANTQHRFHFTIGGVAGVRVTSHTKVYFNEADKEYRLTDPATGIPGFEVYRTPDRNSRNIVKNYSSFYQSPFKFDARVGIGYGWLNVFATYGINRFFQKDRGPELNPWTVGITIVGW